jgi:hypothetical protein
MYCPNCQKAFPDGHAFCDSCGGILVENQPEAAVQAPIQDAPVQETPVQNVYQAPPPPPPPAYNPQPSPAPAYTAPAYAGAPAPQKKEAVSFGVWFIVSLIGIVPFFFGLVSVLAIVVGTVLTLISGASVEMNPIGLALTALTLLYFLVLLIWALGGARKRTLRSYARATLLVSAILIVLMIAGYFILKDYIMNLDLDFSQFAEMFNLEY